MSHKRKDAGDDSAHSEAPSTKRVSDDAALLLLLPSIVASASLPTHSHRSHACRLTLSASLHLPRSDCTTMR